MGAGDVSMVGPEVLAALSEPDEGVEPLHGNGSGPAR
jgi:UDP-N-acetylmuramate--alanine ligase